MKIPSTFCWILTVFMSRLFGSQCHTKLSKLSKYLFSNHWLLHPSPNGDSKVLANDPFLPYGLAIDANCRWGYVTSRGLLLRVDLDTSAIKNVSICSGPRLSDPKGITIDSNGNLYLSDSLTVIKLSLLKQDADCCHYSSTLLAGSFATFGNVNGIGILARFGALDDLVVHTKGSALLIADSINKCVRRLDLSSLEVTTFAYSDIFYPSTLAIDNQRQLLYIGSSSDRSILRVKLSDEMSVLSEHIKLTTSHLFAGEIRSIQNFINHVSEELPIMYVYNRSPVKMTVDEATGSLLVGDYSEDPISLNPEDRDIKNMNRQSAIYYSVRKFATSMKHSTIIAGGRICPQRPLGLDLPDVDFEDCSKDAAINNGFYSISCLVVVSGNSSSTVFVVDNSSGKVRTITSSTSIDHHAEAFRENNGNSQHKIITWNFLSDTPTLLPSLSPTISSGVNPTMRPSIAPSRKPSTRPSLSPSQKPSMKPSMTPSTIIPTRIPSSAVPSTDYPTESSWSPSVNPTEVPTDVPSQQPSDDPSPYPTVLLSPYPSRVLPGLGGDESASNTDNRDGFTGTTGYYVTIVLVCVVLPVFSGIVYNWYLKRKAIRDHMLRQAEIDEIELACAETSFDSVLTQSYRTNLPT